MSSQSSTSTFKGTRDGVGLALPRGGFRVTLFHLGALVETEANSAFCRKSVIFRRYQEFLPTERVTCP